MARISVSTARSGYQITVNGPLNATDLKRLEHACGPALERRSLPLEIVLRGGGACDETVRAYLERLRLRGASVREGTP